MRFQSTPAFSGEGTSARRSAALRVFRFNPPPPFQAREQNYSQIHLYQLTVSIHPRLFRRGNKPPHDNLRLDACFNPPPPFQARELLPTERRIFYALVSIHPRLFRRGNRVDARLAGLIGLVSIHPRLFRRGNTASAVAERLSRGFNPPPPFQAREPGGVGILGPR